MTRESRTKVVTTRVSEAAWSRLAAAAARQGQSLSTYLCDCLERQETLQEQLAGLRQALELLAARPATDTSTAQGGQAEVIPAIFEMLLLLRHELSPAARQTAHKELKRRGMEPWS
ncbi:MAG TPA: hypothetical protein VMK12_11110 [Anaeromyxobacteraceae bacterium]|nr:hypothetical protein [Anaeromyxobacteraceae bacterium]